jgi:hypothetical protein
MPFFRSVAIAATLAISTICASGNASAAPAPQQFRLTCGDQSYTTVSPVEHARASLFSGSTRVGVLMGYNDGAGDVLFSGVSTDKLTTCDAYLVDAAGEESSFGVVYVLITPQGR